MLYSINYPGVFLAWVFMRLYFIIFYGKSIIFCHFLETFFSLVPS